MLLLGLLGKIPILVWVVAAALGWGQLQKWGAERATLKLEKRLAGEAIAREEELRRQLAENARVLKKQQEASVLGQRARDEAEVARMGAERAVGELRDRARALAARACAPASAAPSDGAASSLGGGGPDLLADVLGRLAEDGKRIAAVGDARQARLVECSARYDALTKPP